MQFSVHACDWKFFVESNSNPFLEPEPVLCNGNKQYCGMLRTLGGAGQGLNFNL